MVSHLWTLREVKRAVGVPTHGEDFDIYGVSIDSRTTSAGDIFIALSDKRDGHEFVAEAVKKGAVAVIVEHKISNIDIPQIIVVDCLKALEAMAQYKRDHIENIRIAVTGSCGKTSTKDMLKTVLNAHSNIDSYNNQWGVPITLARIPKNSKIGIFELGTNHAGEIVSLTKMVKPHVAVVTNIAPAHIGFFDDINDIAVEKLSITEGLKEGGKLITTLEVAQNYPHYIDVPFITVALSNKKANVFAESITLSASSQTVVADICGTPVTFSLNMVGEHFVINALLTLAVAYELGENITKVARRLGNISPTTGRGQLSDTSGIIIVDESYNANPESMRAALKAFKSHSSGGKKIAILGTMGELGDKSKKYHIELASICEGLDGVVVIGEEALPLYENLPEDIRIGYYPQQSDMDLAMFVSKLEIGDMVMVKASKTILWVDNFVPRLSEELKLFSARGAT